jgi:transcription initiation factor TFIID subunit 9B
MANPPQLEALLSQPLTSVSDNGSSRRPRDHRLIHLLLASHGIAAYQERVPLQLMDFAYRYTSSVLSDAVHVQAEGYDQVSTSTDTHGRGRGAGRGQGGTGAKGAAATAEEGDVGLSALRMAIASRMAYQFQGSLPKEFLKGLAEERNRIGLGVGLRDQGIVIGGVKLPSEKYCLTGVGWGLKEEWDSEGEEEVDGAGPERGDIDMTQVDRVGGGGEGGDDDEDDEGMGTMEDVFGDDTGDGDGGGGGGGGDDDEMGDT